MNKEQLRMQMLAGIITEDQYKGGLNERLNALYKGLHELYNSGELEKINDEEGLKLRSLLINLCENIGDDLGNLVDLSVYNK